MPVLTYQRTATKLSLSLCLFFSMNLALAVDNMPQQAIPYPKINYGTGNQAKLLKRGEYLTTLGDCIACHTVANGSPFAGGFPISTPFGTIYAPNITSDKKYGIGAWTDAQFIKAMREGISPQGHYYLPAFPYLYFNRITTEDLLAIRAYLQAIPAVAQENRPSELMWPFSWRFLQLGWRTLFFTFEKQGVYQPDPKQSAQWNRGAYIVQGLGHCSMCHTPSYYIFSKKYPLAAPANQYFLAGGMVENYFAPNITSELMGRASIQEISDVFKKDKMIGGGAIQGPMLDANHNSLRYLTQDDVTAIAVYLKTVKSKSPPKESHGTGLDAGKSIYGQYCTGCHATGAGGAPKVGDTTAWGPLIKQGLAVTVHNAIQGIGGMPPKGTCLTCSDEDIKFAVEYMFNESKPGVGSASTPAAKPVPQLTLKEGESVYNTYCAVCHNPSSNYLNAPKLGDKKAWSPLLKKGMDVLFYNTIRGYGNMPMRGNCIKCSDAQLKAALKYMVQKSKTSGDYSLW